MSSTTPFHPSRNLVSCRQTHTDTACLWVLLSLAHAPRAPCSMSSIVDLGPPTYHQRRHHGLHVGDTGGSMTLRQRCGPVARDHSPDGPCWEWKLGRRTCWIPQEATYMRKSTCLVVFTFTRTLLLESLLSLPPYARCMSCHLSALIIRTRSSWACKGQLRSFRFKVRSGCTRKVWRGQKCTEKNMATWMPPGWWT